jgi:hypothetical protein
VNLNRARRATAKATIILGDLNAIQRGRYKERIANRVIGRLSNRLMRKFWR